MEKSINSACNSELRASAVECAYREVEQVALQLSFDVDCVLGANLERF